MIKKLDKSQNSQDYEIKDLSHSMVFEEEEKEFPLSSSNIEKKSISKNPAASRKKAGAKILKKRSKKECEDSEDSDYVIEKETKRLK